MKAIVRPSYLDKIEKYLGKDTIIIIPSQEIFNGGFGEVTETETVASEL